MDFFANLQGSTILETALLLAHVPVSYLLVRATSGSVVNELVCVCALLLVTYTLLATRHNPPQYANNTAASLSAIESSWRAERSLSPASAAMELRMLVSLISLAAVALASHWPRRTLALRRGALVDSDRPEYISFYRSCMMLATCVAILAVDFPIFPRRFAKTETFGVSLMDLGVGGFVFSMALVSPQARGAQQTPFLRSFASVLPLTVLGVVRLVLTRGASLDAHVSEYGIHWNFFMTLATVAIFVALLRVPVRVGAIVGVAILIVYQLALSFGGLTEYIIDHPRTNLLHANKEGLCSWIGYLAIYLFGAECGSWLLRPRPSTETRSYAMQQVAIATVLCWLATLLLSAFVQAPSRRMANAAYVFVTLATNLQTLLLCAFVSSITPRVPLPLMDAINDNQLVVFLAANLLTGAVNLSMRAREQTNRVALVVLSGYMLVVVGVALALKRIGWKLKF